MLHDAGVDQASNATHLRNGTEQQKDIYRSTTMFDMVTKNNEDCVALAKIAVGSSFLFMIL